MPKIALEISANLSNVTDLGPDNYSDFRWHLKFKCTNCGEQSNHWQYVVSEDKFNIPAGRGKANLVEKCKLCSRHNSLSILPDSFQMYKISNNLQFQSLVTFDCRGIEPINFEPRNDWSAVATESSTKFVNIDLTDQEWADYDEIAKVPVEISEWKHRFASVK